MGVERRILKNKFLFKKHRTAGASYELIQDRTLIVSKPDTSENRTKLSSDFQFIKLGHYFRPFFVPKIFLPLSV